MKFMKKNNILNKQIYSLKISEIDRIFSPMSDSLSQPAQTSLVKLSYQSSKVLITIYVVFLKKKFTGSLVQYAIGFLSV